MKTAFYSRVDVFLEGLDAKRQKRYLMRTETYNKVVQVYKFQNRYTCKGTGDCNSNRCQCKKKNRKCFTKCHGGKQSKCKNC